MAMDMAKSLASALGKGKPAKVEVEMEGEGEGGGDGEVLMQDFIDAVKAGDAAAAWSAFKAGHEMCGGYGEDME